MYELAEGLIHLLNSEDDNFGQARVIFFSDNACNFLKWLIVTFFFEWGN